MPQPADAAALDAIAIELYRLPPAQFTAARNARAAASDRPLAALVKRLPKPSVAAWTVGLLAREGRLGEAVELAAALREAQDDLDAKELAALGAQRRSLVAALSRQAVALAEEQGVAVSASTRDDVEKTVNAAVMDAGAAAAVLSGRLVRALEATGFDPVDLAGAVGGTPAEGTPAPEPPRDDLAARRARRAAERAVREADQAASEAERDLTRVAARLAKARDRVDHLRERLDEVRAELVRLEADAAAAQSEADVLAAEHGEASARTREAAGRAAVARAALDDAGG